MMSSIFPAVIPEGHVHLTDPGSHVSCRFTADSALSKRVSRAKPYKAGTTGAELAVPFPQVLFAS